MIEKNCQKLNEKNGVPKGKKSYNLSEIMAILGIWFKTPTSYRSSKSCSVLETKYKA